MNIVKALDVTTVIIKRGGKTLLAQRPLHTDQSGVWELADGRVEPGEGQPEALIRELREELGIEVIAGYYIASHQRKVSDRLVHLHAWHVPSYQGEPRAYEHQDIVWCSPEEALRYPLASAGIPLLEVFILLHAARPVDSC